MRIIVAGKGYNGTDIEELLFANARIEGENAALRAECERLHEQVSSYAGWLWCCGEDVKCAEKRIEKLEAALDQIRSMSSDYHNLSEIYDRAVTVLLAGEEKECARCNTPHDMPHLAATRPHTCEEHADDNEG